MQQLIELGILTAMILTATTFSLLSIYIEYKKRERKLKERHKWEQKNRKYVH